MAERTTLPWEQVGVEHARSLKRAAIRVDIGRCTGCHACSVSCKTEFDAPLGEFRMRVRYLEPEQESETRLSFVPLMCMQCQDAPCMTACKPNALVKLGDGRIVVDEAKCDGNGDCVAACPYGAIYVNPATKKAEKCDMCAHRTAVGLDPACVASCPAEALSYHDDGDPSDPVTADSAARGATVWKEEAGTRPSVRYLGAEPWMEAKANLGVRLSPKDADILYEQANFPMVGDNESKTENNDG